MMIKIFYSIVVFLILCWVFSKNTENFTSVPNLSFPFKHLYTDQDVKLPIVVIGAYFRNDKHKKLYESYKSQGLPMIGVSSYQEFPGEILNPFEDPYYKTHPMDYEAMTSGWLHCFRDPGHYLKSSIPRLLMSESDFVDPEAMTPDTSIQKEYDFIYICLDEGMKHDSKTCQPGWQAHNRNWALAQKCLEVICGRFQLKGLIIGRTNCEITQKCNKIVDKTPFQPQVEFFKLLQKCKFIFVPNVSDASPRVITQAMCYNIPVLMNRNIVGGWKYITDQTGEFFTNESDIIASLDRFLHRLRQGQYRPRQWFSENYGKERSGKRLLEFLKEHVPSLNLDGVNYVTFKGL